MGDLLSPEAAAQRAGVSRRTILRAINRQELQAIRDNRSRWRIDRNSVDAWASPRVTTEQPTEQLMADVVVAHQSAHSEEIVALRIQLAGREAEIGALWERLRAAEADRDAWSDLARQSWWQRLFGSRQ